MKLQILHKFCIYKNNSVWIHHRLTRNRDIETVL